MKKILFLIGLIFSINSFSDSRSPIIYAGGCAYNVLTQACIGGGGGGVSTVSVVPTNGFNGSVANPSTTPAITILTTVSGLLFGSSGAIVNPTNLSWDNSSYILNVQGSIDILSGVTTVAYMNNAGEGGFTHLSGVGTNINITAGPAAGTSPGLVSINGTDVGFSIAILTYHDTQPEQYLAMITWGNAFSVNPRALVCTPQNEAATNAWTDIFIPAPASTQAYIYVGAIPLNANTLYEISCVVIK